MQRKDEILAKKAKLAELRRQREERERKQKELSRRDESGEASNELASTPPSRIPDRENLDRFIDDLVGDRRSSLANQAGTSSPASRSRPTSTADAIEGTSEPISQPVVQIPQAQTASAATQTLSTAPTVTNFEFAPTPLPELQAPFRDVQIQPPGIRTPPRRKASLSQFSDADSGSDLSFTQSPRKTKRLSRRQREREEELRQNLRKEIEEELRVAETAKAEATPSESKYPARPLTNEELNAVTASDDFLDFVERSSKVIERALDQDYNVLADYAQDGVTGADSDEDDGAFGRAKGKRGRRVRQVAQFYDERWSKKRMISDIDFSPKVGCAPVVLVIWLLI
ncbi:MAG: hypothetical protein Q9174_006187 [Haloplaca sp. 1 TL-2023]